MLLFFTEKLLNTVDIFFLKKNLTIDGVIESSKPQNGHDSLGCEHQKTHFKLV